MSDFFFAYSSLLIWPTYSLFQKKRTFNCTVTFQGKFFLENSWPLRLTSEPKWILLDRKWNVLDQKLYRGSGFPCSLHRNASSIVHNRVLRVRKLSKKTLDLERLLQVGQIGIGPSFQQKSDIYIRRSVWPDNNFTHWFDHAEVCPCLGH